MFWKLSAPHPSGGWHTDTPNDYAFKVGIFLHTPQIFKRFALRLVCHFKKCRKAYFDIQSSHTGRTFTTAG